MPYAWTDKPSEETLHLWPHQSLTRQGSDWFFGVTAAMLALPLVALLGSPAAWFLLVFFIIALFGVWRAIMVNHKSRARLRETLTFSDERVHLRHVPKKGDALEWEANPYWVRVKLTSKGRVENYLTLKGGGREVELGAFLSPEERKGLYDDLLGRLSQG